MSSLYLLLIAIVILFSWVGSIYALPLPDGSVIPNLLSDESIRWFVRHGVDNISAAPLVEVLLVLVSIGALRSSGLFAAIVHRASLTTRRHHHAFRIALVVFVICVILVLIGLAPGGNLLSVTGHLSGGPFASGWLLVLACVLVFPAFVYGRMSGHWHSANEIFAGLSSEIASSATCLITLLIASQFVAAIRYVHLFELLNLSYTMQRILIALVYYTPLIVCLVTNNSTHEPSSTE